MCNLNLLDTSYKILQPSHYAVREVKSTMRDTVGQFQDICPFTQQILACLPPIGWSENWKQYVYYTKAPFFVLNLFFKICHSKLYCDPK